MDILLCIPGANERWKQAVIERVNALIPDVRLCVWPDVGGAPARIEVMVAGSVPAGIWDTLPGLRWVMGLGAGVDTLLPVVPARLMLTRLVDPLLTADMTQYVLYQVLRFHRGFHEYEADQAAGRWHKRHYPRPDERTVGILGLGELGRAAAAQLASLGFSVLGWSRTAKNLAGVSSHCGPAGLDHVLAHSHILVCLLPHTTETENLLDAAALARMPAGGYVINAARGAVVVDDDLIAALDAGHLAGAALDVFRQEPLAPEHPFFTHPRIWMTPHIASLTHPDSVAALLADNLDRFRAGQPLRCLVGRERGY